MADATFEAADGYVREVLTGVVENYAFNNSALITMGLATDATAAVDYAQGGNHVTRVEFRGNVAAVKKSASTPETQQVSYTGVKYPCATSIISLSEDGSAIQDVWDNEGYVNRVAKHIKEKVVDDLDNTLLTYTVNIGDGSKNYGASGTALTADVSAEDTNTLCYNNLVVALSKFKDNPGRTICLANSKQMADLLLSTEAKNMQQGIVSGSISGIMLPALNMIVVATDKIAVNTATYTALVCKQDCMSFAWKDPLRVKEVYVGNDVSKRDFIFRYAIMRNYERGLDKIVALTTATNQSTE